MVSKANPVRKSSSPAPSRKPGGEETERLTRLLDRLGLPTDLDERLNSRALGFIGADKKRRGDKIHFVIPRLPGQTQIELLGLDEVRAALLPS